MEPDNLRDLYKELKLLNGVVEVGLFCGIAQVAYFGNAVSSFVVISDT